MSTQPTEPAAAASRLWQLAKEAGERAEVQLEDRDADWYYGRAEAFREAAELVTEGERHGG